MKKLFLSFVAVLMLVSVSAQDSLRLFKKDGTVYSFALVDVDSIKFVKKAPVVKVNSISLNRTAIGLLQGYDYTLLADVDYEETAPTVKWQSSDSSIASVDVNGRVSPLKAGSATITATAGDKQASCAITVVANGESVYRHGYSELSADDKVI
ncbi:MAG: Ig domain-containing protein, partial [Paludibacteraceae bacterium]|nr:Ig domain-containing protein [Paludibacteraceae bacterium]